MASFPHHSTDRSERHSIFANFITATLVADGADGPVLDVAGGKGHLSTALRELDQTSVLIDPCAESGRVFGPNVLYPPTSICLPISSTLQTIAPTAPIPPTLKLTLSEAVNAHPHLVEGSSCIVGLHPDEATEQIVTTALALDKPFAVIPCCVLPHLFNRTLNNKQYSAKTVRKFGSFLSYLRSLDPRIRITTLPFPGRNTVLYMAASHYLAPPPRKINSDLAAIASKRGDIKSLAMLRARIPPADLDEECCQAAAWAGHLATLEWLRANECPWDATTCEGALKSGSWDVLRYAIENRCPGYAGFVAALTAAAANNNSDNPPAPPAPKAERCGKHNGLHLRIDCPLNRGELEALSL